MAHLLIALSDRDFDATEVAVPWSVFTRAGYQVTFATTTGGRAACDPMTLTGVFLGQFAATEAHRVLYQEMIQTQEFLHPISHADIQACDYEVLHLPGGHAPGMRPYLESEALFLVVRSFLEQGKPLGAICHGGVVLARSGGEQGRTSMIAGRTLTALPKFMEFAAWVLTAWKIGDHFRTYPTWVQQEVEQALGTEGQFRTGPWIPSYAFPFVVRDENLVTARWPGDAERYAEVLLEVAEAQTSP
jgi:putative intracellular protease/amidase